MTSSADGLKPWRVYKDMTLNTVKVPNTEMPTAYLGLVSNRDAPRKRDVMTNDVFVTKWTKWKMGAKYTRN